MAIISTGQITIVDVDDGKTQYTHLAYADNITGGGFSKTDTNKKFIGIYQDFNAYQSDDPKKYTWSKWQGSDGVNGVPGQPGRDGRTPYIHFAWANNSTGTEGFTTSKNDATRKYMGVYTDYTQTDSTNPADYTWQRVKGEDGANGVPGRPGADGRTPYVHFAYADSEDGRTGFTVLGAPGKKYMGTYTDFNQPDSTDPTKYKWSLIKGADGAKGDRGDTGPKGDQGIPGQKGADGNGTKVFSTSTRYTQYAFDSYAKGSIDTFIVSESTADTKVGDAVYIKTFNIDKDAYAWVVGIVTEIIGPGKIKIQSKGIIENGEDGVFDGVVGRRNLLKGTRLLESAGAASDDYIFGEYNGFKTVKSIIGANTETKYKTLDMYSATTTLPMTGTEYTLMFWARANRNDYNCIVHLFRPSTVENVKTSTGYMNASGKDGFYGKDGYAECRITTEWKQYWVKWTQTSVSEVKKVIIGRHGYNYGSKQNDWLEICAPCLFEGAIVGDYIEAPEDTEKQLNSKADQSLTQDQLNKLAERDAQLKAEMDAKAATDLVEKWINEIKNLSAVEEAGRKEAELAAIRASERIVDLQRKVGELKLMTEFVDTYMSQSEEGLIVGRKDGASKVLVSNDRISFISGGKEVASISQGVLQIDNGVFVKSLRIGRFVTIQDPTNLNRNLTMFVGGA